MLPQTQQDWGFGDTGEERIDGALHITYNGQYLRFQEITKKLTRDTAKTLLPRIRKKLGF